MNDHDEILKRLKDFRKSLGLCQQQIGKILGISQVRYSYLENGIIRLSHGDLAKLYEIGLDPDYLITGKSFGCNAGDLEEAIDRTGRDERAFVVRITAEVIVEKWKRCGYAGCTVEGSLSETAAGSIRFLKASLASREVLTMLGFVREDKGLMQTDMMERFGIGSRKYRLLEKGKQYPDVDLLLSFYKEFGYPPSMFMNIDDIRFMAVRAVWNELDKIERSKLLELIGRIGRIGI